MRNIPFSWTTLYADHESTIIFVPVTGWLSAADLLDLRAVFDLHGIMGNFKCRPAFEVANDRGETPTSSTPIETAYTSSAEVSFPGGWTNVASTVASKQLIRFGFECLISSAGAPAMASVSGQIQAIVHG
jgi:hypothetical protein